MRIENDVKLDYSDVLFRPKRSVLGTRKEVELTREFTFRNYNNKRSPHYTGLPIMASNMDGVGTFEMADALRQQKMFTCLKKDYTAKELGAYLNTDSKRKETVAITTGILNEDVIKIEQVFAATRYFKYLCIDVANGYSERFVDFVSAIREKHSDLVIIAGNVVTPEVTEELLLRGADIIKVGIGPGSVCTTRIKTGVGYPQLSAVIECADAAHGLGGHIIADGGCSSPGDVAKAFGAGADFVMLGGMLAGHDEGGGEVNDGKITFYGMSSNKAQKNTGNIKQHRASEGRVVSIPHKGSVKETIKDILGGLRSTCTYVGAKTLKSLSKCTTFIRVNNGKQYNQTFESQTIGD